MSKYALHHVKTAGGEETPRFEASLCRGSVHVGFVSNSGTGGCCKWTFITNDEKKAFEAFIAEQTGLGEFEPDDKWAYDQLTLIATAKKAKRSWLFSTHADRDQGRYRAISRKALADEKAFIAYLKARYDKGIHIFDSKTSAWKELV